MKTCDNCINKGICSIKGMIALLPLKQIGIKDERMYEMLGSECNLYMKNDLYYNPVIEDVK